MGFTCPARRLRPLPLAAIVALSGCDRGPQPADSMAQPDEPSPAFRNVATPTQYVGDSSCTACHASEASAYGQHAMSQTFRRRAAGERIDARNDTGVYHRRTGLFYSVTDVGGQPYQVEYLRGPGGRRLHELRRRMDWVIGSGSVARTYLSEENGRLFQLPLTWYRDHGWDFSPGYDITNARFDRLTPDRCIACHSSYPQALPFIDGKYAALRPGIGCERCHGPGALHVTERRAGAPPDTGFDNTIVNPARLPLERRLDVCEQCHVHTPVAVLREGRHAFSYLPSQPLRDQYAFYKAAGDIDVVSHADRLRQSACFIATRSTSRPLECATCHNPHLPPPDSQARNQPCQSCHSTAALDRRLAGSALRANHRPGADCVNCHMPRVKERTVPHGTFTEHWIRVAARDPERRAIQRDNGGPIEPYYERDRSGPEALIYRGMGEIVYATQASSGRLMGAAAAGLRRALVRDTTHGEAHFLLGVAYEQLGKTDDAIRALEQSLHIDSTRPDALRALAQAYDRAGRSPAEIDRLYQRALALQPALAWIRAERADFLRAQGRASEAETEYRRALREQPSLAIAWFNLGTLIAETGRRPESTDAFAQAVHLDPALAEALAPLLQIRTRGSVVTTVERLGSPLPSLPVRARGPGAFQMADSTGRGGQGIQFLNVPENAFVQILKPDGTLVRALTTRRGGTLSWDILNGAGQPIAGGLYRARALTRDASGRLLAPQFVYFGIVRQRAE